MASPDELGDGMEVASSCAGENGRTTRTLDMRVLLMVLAGKGVTTNTVELQLAHSRALQITKIVKHLHANPDQISTAEVVVLGGCKGQVMTKKGRGQAAKDAEVAALNTEPNFDSTKVKFLSDVPALWLWGFLRKNIPEGVLDSTVSAMSAKSSKNLRRVMNFFTGLSDQYPIAEELLCKETFSSFLLQRMAERGDPHKKKFLEKSVSAAGEPKFVGKDFGCYYIKPRDDNAEVAGFIVHSVSDTSAPFGDGEHMKLPMSTPIMDNWGDYSAYVVVLGAKHFCHKLFKDTPLQLKKPGRKDMLENAASAVRKHQEMKQANVVELDSSLAGVAKRRRPNTPPKAAGLAIALPPPPPPGGAAPPEEAAAPKAAAQEKAPGAKPAGPKAVAKRPAPQRGGDA